jgi:hypothetical protein
VVRFSGEKSEWGFGDVERLSPAKFAKIKLRQDILQTTFSVLLDIFYPPNFGVLNRGKLPLSYKISDFRLP